MQIVGTAPGSTLDLGNAERELIRVRHGSLTLKGLTLVRFWAEGSAGGSSPLAGVAPDGGGSLVLDGCTLVAAGTTLDALQAASPFWRAATAAAAAAAAGAAAAEHAGAAAGLRVLPVDFTATQLGAAGATTLEVRRSLLVVDPAGCYAPGPGRALVGDAAGFVAALADASVSAVTVAGHVSLLEPLLANAAASSGGGGGGGAADAVARLAAAPPLARQLEVGGCTGSSLDFGGLADIVAVGAGGDLVLAAPLRLLASRPAGPLDGGAASPLAAVRADAGGRVALAGATLEVPGASAVAEGLWRQQGRAPQRSGDTGSVVVANLTTPDGGTLTLAGAVLSDGPSAGADAVDCTRPGPGDAVASDAAQLRAALTDAGVSRVLVAGDITLGRQGTAGGPWGRGGGGAAPPAGPLILARPVEVRGCAKKGWGGGLGGGGGGDAAAAARWAVDFADAAGALVLADGAALRFAGPLLLRPCSGGGPACAAAWPLVPAVSLGPGAGLQLLGVAVEGSTPTPWAGGGPPAGADFAWVQGGPGREGDGGERRLALRRLALGARDAWASVLGAGGKGRRLLAGRAAPGGAGAAAAREPNYVFLDVTVVLRGPALAAATAAAAARKGPDPRVVGGATAGAVAGAATIIAAALLARRRSRRARGAAAAAAAASACSSAGKGLPVYEKPGFGSQRWHSSSGRTDSGRLLGSAAAPVRLSDPADSAAALSAAVAAAAAATAGHGGAASGGLFTLRDLSFLVAGRARSESLGSAPPPPPAAGAAAAAAHRPPAWSAPLALHFSGPPVPAATGSQHLPQTQSQHREQAPPSQHLRPGSLGAGGALSSGGGGCTGAAQHRQQALESAARTVQALHEGSAWRHSREDLVMDTVLGAGTFGMVYRAWWKGTLVAVKRMIFPAGMSTTAKRERMAIMETAISSRLRHPNIVQLYSFYLRPVAAPPGDSEFEGAAQRLDDSFPSLPEGQGEELARAFLAGEDDAAHFNWEVRLVLEYCDRGSLRSLLGEASAFTLPDGTRDMRAIIDCAMDVAKAMLHLHSVNVVHSDLKARNVLLKTAAACADDARGYVAKVADFGLSIQLPDGASHVSGTFQGTMTHMAPEVMTMGRVSKASDVYAFGVVLWELFTGEHAFRGVPRALLGHEVAYQQRRPDFPPDCPFDFQLLACRCWESDFTIRPSFSDILEQLHRMRLRMRSPEPPRDGGSAGTGGLSGALPGSSGPLLSAAAAQLSGGAASAPGLATVVGTGTAGAASRATATGGGGGDGGVASPGDELLPLGVMGMTRLQGAGTLSGSGGDLRLDHNSGSARSEADARSHYVSEPVSSESDGDWAPPWSSSDEDAADDWDGEDESEYAGEGEEEGAADGAEGQRAAWAGGPLLALAAMGASGRGRAALHLPTPPQQQQQQGQQPAGGEPRSPGSAPAALSPPLSGGGERAGGAAAIDDAHTGVTACSSLSEQQQRCARSVPAGGPLPGVVLMGSTIASVTQQESGSPPRRAGHAAACSPGAARGAAAGQQPGCAPAQQRPQSEWLGGARTGAVVPMYGSPSAGGGQSQRRAQPPPPPPPHHEGTPPLPYAPLSRGDEMARGLQRIARLAARQPGVVVSGSVAPTDAGASSSAAGALAPSPAPEWLFSAASSAIAGAARPAVPRPPPQ